MANVNHSFQPVSSKIQDLSGMEALEVSLSENEVIKLSLFFRRGKEKRENYTALRDGYSFALYLIIVTNKIRLNEDKAVLNGRKRITHY